MDNKERRLGEIELREADESGDMIIEGYAAVFDSETLIGSEKRGFYEKIARGAFDGADMHDVCLRYNHSDTFSILARTRNDSLQLSVDEKGLFVRAKLLDTQVSRDMYKSIQAGLLDKMSFAFTIREDEWDDSTNPVHRTIKRFDRLFDVSVVDTPAYEETSIYARSLEKAEAHLEAVETEKETRKKAEELALEKQRLEIMVKLGGLN